ncbi:MAG: alpha/beta hydrolase-fold protein [Mobilitalea sp.]
MALIQTDFYSKTLSKVCNFNIILPNDIIPEMVTGNECYNRKMKTLYLLHGYSGSSKDWLLGTSVQEMAMKYNLAVVMPCGDNSFYLDGRGTGKAYCEYSGKELIEYTRETFGLSDKKEDTFIGGYSMGGFGALHTGLRYPETFHKIIALSSALIVHNIKNMKEDARDEIADYDYYTSTFGNLEQLDTSINNPEYQISSLKKEGKAIPSIYMACGSEDFLIEPNRAFHEFLRKEEIEVEYHETTGIHDWTFWNQYLEPAIKWMLS